MSDDIQTESTPQTGDGIFKQDQDEVTTPTDNTSVAQDTDWANQLEALKHEAQTNLEGWQRARADFTNYKKRMERELSDLREKVALDTLVKLLPIVDDFERAIHNTPADLSEHPWVSGTALILKKFDKLMDEYKVTTIDPVGQPFDPHQHEAVGMDDPVDGIASGHVTATLQKGYLCGERVLRPALVRVAS